MVEFGGGDRPRSRQRLQRRAAAAAVALVVLGVGAALASGAISHGPSARSLPVAAAPVAPVAVPAALPAPASPTPAAIPVAPPRTPIPLLHSVPATTPSLDAVAAAIVTPPPAAPNALAYPTIRETALSAGSLAPPGVLEHALATMPGTRLVRFRYRSADGGLSLAYILAPRDLARPVPLVIAPHGRGGDGITACAHWGGLPAFARVAVVCPDGTGRFSWGSPAQISDLARMPQLAAAALPAGALTDKVFAIGESMGGQEVLLLHGEHPGLLSGVVALDPVTDFSLRYSEIGSLPGGAALQQRMRTVIAGTPVEQPEAYRARSPLTYVGAIAKSNAVLVIWWSQRDIVVRSWNQITPFLDAVQRANPSNRRVWSRQGEWKHGAPERRYLINAIDALGLLKGVDVGPAPGRAALLDIQFADASAGTPLR